MNSVGLVLEGGGLRGVYTSGVLDYFMDKELYFPYCIGVSAGACNGVSYISRQKERSKRININYVNDKRYLSYRNLIKERSIFGIDFVYNELPNNLDPFDYDTFFSTDEEFVIVATDCISGKPVYYSRNNYKDNKEHILTLIRASSSLPFMAPVVSYEKCALLDGGISDSIPIKKSIADGNKKNIIVLTRNYGYRKEPFKMEWLAKRMYSRYPAVVEAMKRRHVDYNETLDYIKALEEESKAVVIRPTAPVTVGRLEKDKNKLIELYEMGYNDAAEKYNQIIEYVEE